MLCNYFVLDLGTVRTPYNSPGPLFFHTATAQGHQHRLLSREVAHNAELLSEAAKNEEERKHALNTARAEVARLATKAADQADQGAAQAREVVKLGAALAAQTEECRHLTLSA